MIRDDLCGIRSIYHHSIRASVFEWPTFVWRPHPHSRQETFVHLLSQFFVCIDHYGRLPRVVRILVGPVRLPILPHSHSIRSNQCFGDHGDPDNVESTQRCSRGLGDSTLHQEAGLYIDLNIAFRSGLYQHVTIDDLGFRRLPISGSPRLKEPHNDCGLNDFF